MKLSRNSAVVLAIVVVLPGCALFTSVAYFDANTYQALTHAKPVVALLYESFENETVDMEQVAAFRMRMAQMLEYELGKGNSEAAQVKQIRKIQGMFERHVADRVGKDGRGKPWDVKYTQGKTQMILAAFDSAIRTEEAKNKNPSW